AHSLQAPELRKFLAENLGHEPNGRWDFETLSWVAFYYHPSLALARAQWTTARAVQEGAGLRPNPTLMLTPGYNTTREPGISPWLPSVSLDFLFSTRDKRRRERDVAREDAEAARLGVLSAAWQVRSDLRRALTELDTDTRRE